MAEKKHHDSLETGNALHLRLGHYLKSQWPFWVLVMPGVLLLFAFVYMPMFGIVLAFKNFHIDRGIWGSQWVGFENFKFFFQNEYAWRATRNTVFLNALFISSAHLFAIFCAIALFEVRMVWFRRGIQTITYFPSFLSWVTIGVLALSVFSPGQGSLNNFIIKLGFEPVQWYSLPSLWPGILTLLNTWKGAGVLIVIYIAALTNINPEYYEAAKIDGASFWNLTRHVTLPHLAPTIVILVIMAVGNIFRGDTQMMLALIDQQSQLYPTTDVLDFYVYRSLMKSMDVGMPAAVGLYQSCVGFILVLGANWLARRYQREGALF